MKLGCDTYQSRIAFLTDDDMTASYMELSAKRVELQKAADSAEKMDLGRYACVGELTRELLTELIREIRVSGENDLEIVWNFRE